MFAYYSCDNNRCRESCYVVDSTNLAGVAIGSAAAAAAIVAAAVDKALAEPDDVESCFQRRTYQKDFP